MIPNIDRDYLKLKVSYCRFILYDLLRTVRTPRFKSKEFNAALEDKSIPATEIAEYYEIRKDPLKVVIVQILLTSLYSIKNVLMFLVMLFAFDHNDPFMSLEVLDAPGNSSSKLHKFSCLATDCPRFTNSSLRQIFDGEDLSESRLLGAQFAEIPIVSLCYPTFSSIYTPARDCGNVGLLVFAVSALCISLLCAGYPLAQIAFPNGSEMLLSILTPNMARVLMEERIRKKVEEFQVSLENYLSPESYANFATLGPLAAERMGLFRRRLGYRRMIKPSEELVVNIEDYKSDCMPSCRSPWWRDHLSGAVFWIHLSLVLAACFLWYLIQSVYMQIVVDGREAQLEEYESYTRSINCSLWYHEDASRSPIRLGEINVQWRFLSLIENFIFHFWALRVIIHVTVYFLGAYIDLECMTLELRRFFAIVIESTKFERLNQGNKMSTFAGSAMRQGHQRQQNVCIAEVRRSFAMETDNRHEELDQAPRNQLQIKLEDRKLLQKMVASGKLDEHSRADMMNKLYINYRLLADQLNHYNPSLVMILVCCWLATYILVFLTVWLNRRIVNFTFEPLIVVAVCWFVSNVFVAYVSNFHASARKLEPLMWSLLANMEFGDDIKQNHLRLLWLKQVKRLSGKGGLAIEMLGFRITYVNILQMAIWTATLLVFAVRPNG